jgi:hypothetical protein
MLLTLKLDGNGGRLVSGRNGVIVSGSKKLRRRRLLLVSIGAPSRRAVLLICLVRMQWRDWRLSMRMRIGASDLEMGMRLDESGDDKGKRLHWPVQESLLVPLRVLLRQMSLRGDRDISLGLGLSPAHIWKKGGVLK